MESYISCNPIFPAIIIRLSSHEHGGTKCLASDEKITNSPSFGSNMIFDSGKTKGLEPFGVLT